MHLIVLVHKLGEFLARSSVNLLAVDRIWEMTALQCISVIIALLQILFVFMPSLLMILTLLLWVGMLSGLTYVNTFYLMNKEVPFIQQKFALGLASFGDSIGMLLGCSSAMLIHYRLCEMNLHTI